MSCKQYFFERPFFDANFTVVRAIRFTVSIGYNSLTPTNLTVDKGMMVVLRQTKSQGSVIVDKMLETANLQTRALTYDYVINYLTQPCSLARLNSSAIWQFMITFRLADPVFKENYVFTHVYRTVSVVNITVQLANASSANNYIFSKQIQVSPGSN